jgi:hypothetical protein
LPAALTHSPARLQILLLPCASRHTCDDYHDDSLRVSHRLHLPTLATSKLQNLTFSGLASRDTRTAHSPRHSRSATNRTFFSPISLCFKPLVETRQTAFLFSRFLVLQASFFHGVRGFRKLSNANRCTHLPPPGKSVHCDERERERERPSQVHPGFPDDSPKTRPLFFCSFSFKFVLRRTLPLITVIKH